MANTREPLLKPIPILSLRPTQMTVGIREVKEKRKHWRENSAKKRAKELGKHMVPVVAGPTGHLYIIDHHHLARALHDEGEKDVLVSMVADLRMVDRDAFWTVLDGHKWVHPYDHKGRRRDYKSLPKTVVEMVDDPYRSLAGELRRAGGYAKDTTPFSEFFWADFLRPRVGTALIKRDFTKAIEHALKHARSNEAIYLPGWCGPADDDGGD